MKKFTLLIVTCICLVATVSAQAIVGVWKTIDDETGLARSHVQIYKAKNGMYYGKILKLMNRQPNEEEQPKCIACPKGDYRYNQPVIGMKILTKLKKSGDEFKGGSILDPKKGKIYTCKVWLEDANTLKLRGYLGPFYRTQTWYRIK